MFPDAGAVRDTAASRYVETDEGAVLGGSFMTRFDEDGVSITCVARFRGPDEGSWLEPAELAGWDLATSVRPPAAQVVVEVTAAAGGVSRSGRLVREAGADPVPRPLPAGSAGPW